MLRFNSISLQVLVRKVLEIVGNDNVSAGYNRGGEDVPVVRIRQLQRWDQIAVILNEAIPYARIPSSRVRWSCSGRRSGRLTRTLRIHSS